MTGGLNRSLNDKYLLILSFISDIMYKCKLCGYECDWQLAAVKHHRTKHSQMGGDAGSADNLSDTGPQLTAVPPQSSPSPGSTVHTNPLWMDEFKLNFFEIVVSKCSEVTKDAFEKNKDVKVTNDNDVNVFMDQ